MCVFPPSPPPPTTLTRAQLDMAPEVAFLQECDFKADIFSFSLILFELLFGKHVLLPMDGKHSPPPASTAFDFSLGLIIICQNNRVWMARGYS